jgi:hypothetical protein
VPPARRCDGSEPQRKYYGNLAKRMPTNTMVLTLGCGKFRIFDQDFGMLPGTGLPRLLDMGQCNDAYSALVVAQVLHAAAAVLPSLPLLCSFLVLHLQTTPRATVPRHTAHHCPVGVAGCHASSAPVDGVGSSANMRW